MLPRNNPRGLVTPVPTDWPAESPGGTPLYPCRPRHTESSALAPLLPPPTLSFCVFLVLCFLLLPLPFTIPIPYRSLSIALRCSLDNSLPASVVARQSPRITCFCCPGGPRYRRLSANSTPEAFLLSSGHLTFAAREFVLCRRIYTLLFPGC